MASFRIAALPKGLAAEVRGTLRSVQYPHPAHTELATGTGPCRECLDTFEVGEEERILFTYQPFCDPDTLPAPGPVFIHRKECCRYEASEFPPGLRRLPLAFDAFGNGGLLRHRIQITDGHAENVVDRLFDLADVQYLHVRHGEAGCFIARIDRLTPN